MVISNKIKKMIAANRKLWIKEMVYGYRIPRDFLWRHYGYQSQWELEKDLMYSFQNLSESQN